MKIKKQLVDQTAHFAWAYLAVVIGLSAAPLGYAFIAMHAAAIVYREYRQWPSTRWYDPPLDWAFYALGACVGLFW